MSENKNNEIEEKKKRKKKNIAILVLMFLLLLCLFIVQCHLDRIKQEALRRQQETELEARQRYILDSLRRAEQMRADSLAALEQARLADSLRIADSLRLADSLRIADSLAALNPKLNQDAVGLSQVHIYWATHNLMVELQLMKMWLLKIVYSMADVL